MNENQISMMEHAMKNQNRFYAGVNNIDWNDLVSKGYATKRGGWDEDSAYYIPTSEGQAKLKELVSK